MSSILNKAVLIKMEVAMSRYLELEDRENADESREEARLIIAAAKK